MSVRFVIGRAGSGKTHRCLEAVRARLRVDPAGGPPLLLIVPEQISFQAEKALVETPDIPGFIRCQVLSFNRLAFRIFAETGADPRRGDETIGEFGRMMVLRRLLRRRSGDLRLMGPVADRPGLIRALAGTVEELLRENAAPETLLETAAGLEADDPLGAARLADVGVLYRDYLEYLSADRIDPGQYLQLAAGRMAMTAWLDGAEVWVDGFAGFTAGEISLLVELARRAAALEITMLLDPRASAVESDTLPAVSYSRFARAERTLVRLRQTLRAEGIPLEAPVRLTDTPRFASAALASLERHLFVGRAEGSSPAGPPDAVRLLAFRDRRAEVEGAAAEILRLVRDGDPPMRFRDISVVVRSLEPYHDLISAEFRSCGIPFFLDRRQPTTGHPLVELVRGLLSLGAEDLALPAVRLTLKTGLTGLEDGGADLLENYLLAHGIAGRSAWEREWTYTRIFQRKGRDNRLDDRQQAALARVNELRLHWLRAVGPWLELCAPLADRPGRQWATGLLDTLAGLDVAGQLASWSLRAEADGRPQEAQTHRQVWTDLMALLDEFVRALGDELLSLTTVRETIESALAELTLGLAPPALDQVLVCEVERSRHPAVRASLLLGFDEKHFPRRGAEDPLLGDAEREALERSGLQIGPPRIRRLADERMLAYIAMTRPSERLWISFPAAEDDGSALLPSAYLDAVREAVAGLEIETAGTSTPNPPAETITSVRRLGERLAAEFGGRQPLDKDADRDRRGSWNALYEAARCRDDWRPTLRRALAGLAYRNQAALPSGLMAQALGDSPIFSVSRLERFAQCPFAHFVEHVLALTERVEAELRSVDLGNLCHAILERFVAGLVREKRALGDLEDEQIADRIQAVTDELLPAMRDELMLADDPRQAFLADRTRGHLLRSVCWQRNAARAGRLRPAAAEYAFGYGPGTGPPLELTTPKGRVVRLRGKIDRIDLAEVGDHLLALVVDYKRTPRKQLSLAQMYHGLAMQLVCYLLALLRAGLTPAGRPAVIRPAGAVYVPLLEAFRLATGPNDEKARRALQARGLIDRAGVEVLDSQAVACGQSAFYAIRLTGEGQPHASQGDVLRSEDTEAVLAHVERTMARLADRMIDGDIAVRPYRLNRYSPCSFCGYQAVCRFEPGLNGYNLLASMRRGEVLEAIRGGAQDA